MGLILSRFKSKATSKDKLEKIDDEIKSLEEYKFIAIKQQKHLIGLLFFVSGLIYIISSIVFYFFYFPKTSTWQRKSFFAISLVIFVILVYLLKRALQWYYRWVIDSKENRLRELRKEKRKILDKIMETETYKVAKELLEKYEPSALKDHSSSYSYTPQSSLSNLTYRGSHLKTNISFTGIPRQAHSPPNRPSLTFSTYPSTQSLPNASPLNIQRPQQMPVPRLSRPILSQDRTIVEKLVDYVVGDGPNNRYALICKNCFSHNGMALKEEFEYLSFRCCYCSTFNPARKERKFAPSIMALSYQSSTQEGEERRSVSPVVDEPESDKENEPMKSSELPTITELEDTKDVKEINKENLGEEKEKKEEEEKAQEGGKSEVIDDKNEDLERPNEDSDHLISSTNEEAEAECDSEEKQVLL